MTVPCIFFERLVHHKTQHEGELHVGDLFAVAHFYGGVSRARTSYTLPPYLGTPRSTSKRV